MSDVVTQARPRHMADMPDLPALYRRADALNVTPGWIPRDKPLLWREPKSHYAAHSWRYDDIKHALDAAGSLIDVTLAERRNLVLRNPAPIATFETLRTFACAYQMILPGEAAPTHRHSPHALRVILEAKGAFSVVDGEKTPMETGDVVLTPGMSWHGHGHEGDEAAYWFDGLDVPAVHLLEPMFFEEHPAKFEKITRVATDSPYRFSRDAMAKRLDAAKIDPDGFQGRVIELDANSMPTMRLTMSRLSSGEKTRRQRSTANHVFVVVEGSGETTAGTARLTWKKGDTIAVPAWTKFEHAPAADTLMFCMSDEPLMRFAKYFRFEAD